jgi:MATE family multidrug resistance protein
MEKDTAGTRAGLRQEALATLRLAVPVVAAQLAQMSMGLADTIMVGRLGTEALAGVALGNTIFFFLLLVSMGVVMAIGPMVSQGHGAGDRETIERSVRQGFWLGAALAVPAFVLLWNVAPLLRAIGQPPDTVSAAEGYLHAIVWGYLPFLWFMALRSFVEGLSRPLPVTVIASAGVALNIAANYTLMYGAFGLPAMGLVGTGWASTMVYWYLLLALALFVSRDSTLRGYRVFRKIGRPDPRYFRELVRIGWPIGVSLGVESGLFMATALMIGLIGTTALAAHQVALQCAAFTFMVPLGVGMAASIRVGQAAGRGDRHGVRRAGFVGIGLAALFMSAAAVGFRVLPEMIIGFFLDLDEPSNQPVVDLAVVLLGVAAIFQVFDGIQVSAAGALRGLKDTRWPMVIGFVAYWLIGLTSGSVFGFVFGWGAEGLWWGLVLGLAAASLLLTLRFHRLAGLDDGYVESIVQKRVV